jgi:hypothetical protein
VLYLSALSALLIALVVHAAKAIHAGAHKFLPCASFGTLFSVPGTCKNFKQNKTLSNGLKRSSAVT